MEGAPAEPVQAEHTVAALQVLGVSTFVQMFDNRWN